jgi:hypothetical protein
MPQQSKLVNVKFENASFIHMLKLLTQPQNTSKAYYSHGIFAGFFEIFLAFLRKISGFTVIPLENHPAPTYSKKA